MCLDLPMLLAWEHASYFGGHPSCLILLGCMVEENLSGNYRALFPPFHLWDKESSVSKETSRALSLDIYWGPLYDCRNSDFARYVVARNRL